MAVEVVSLIPVVSLACRLFWLTNIHWNHAYLMKLIRHSLYREQETFNEDNS
jgi:hypothetical protein